MELLEHKLAYNRRQLAALAGMIGSLLFVVTFTLEGFRPGYNALGMFVSELSLGPYGWIQIVNFIVSGTLLTLFAWGVRFEFKEGKASKAGPILLAIIGICLLISGPFVMDPTNTPVDQASWHGALHQLFGVFVFLLSPISCFVFWRRFRIDRNWRSLKWWTLAAGIIIVGAVVLLDISGYAGKVPSAPDVLSQWAGLIQRTALVTYLAWIFTFALKLYRQRGQVGSDSN